MKAILTWIKNHKVATIIIVIIAIGLIGASSSETPSTAQQEAPEAVVEMETEEVATLGTYTLNGNLGDGLDHMKINLWQSYEDRTLVIGLENGNTVDLLERKEVEADYDYCKVKYKDFIGWLACDWLQE